MDLEAKQLVFWFDLKVRLLSTFKLNNDFINITILSVFL